MLLRGARYCLIERVNEQLKDKEATIPRRIEKPSSLLLSPFLASPLGPPSGQGE